MADKNEYILLSKEIYTSLTNSEPDALEEKIIALKINKLFSMVREGISEEVISEHKELICYTAALMTSLDISCKENAIFRKPVKLGDMTFERTVGTEGLKALINTNLRELSPILYDNKFIFKVMETDKNEV